MTSSPAPDLDELERLFDSAVGADFLPVGWQAVFGYVPALLQELRAAREAAAESGRLREALRRVVDWWDLEPPDFMEKYGTLNTDKALGPARALLATPPAPSDHGAGERDAETLAGWFHEAYERLAAAFGYETRKASAVPWADVPEPNRTLMVAVAADVLARLATPSVPPEPASPEAT